MAFNPLRLRRALSLSYSLLERSVHGYKPQPFFSISAARPLPTPAAATQLMRRPFTSTTTLFRRQFNPETDEIGPDTILFEGCDYNHWLITVDFPKDANISREVMIDTYVDIATQVFGSVEEAKKRIYALSTTTYQGFQVECSEATSEKFKSIPQVVFVLPDSYINPENKEYGGDKYVNGEIFPRPPPVHYGRTNNRDRRPRENYGPPPQQNYGPPPQQNLGPPPQQNLRPPPQQNLRPPPQQNFGTPPQQNYGQPPQQNFGQPPPPNFGMPAQPNFGTPRQPNFGTPPQPNMGTPPQPNFGTTLQPNMGTPPQPNFGTPPQQNFGTPPQQNFGTPPQHNYGSPSPQQNFRPPPQQNYGSPSPQQNYGSPSPQQNYGSPQQQNYKPPQPGYTSQPRQSYGSPPEQSYTPSTRGSYENSSNLPPYPNYNAAGSGERSGYISSDPERKHQSHARPGQRGFSQDADYGASQDGAFGQVSGGYRNF